jgi:PAS domain S-box-containing protein
MSQAPPLCAQGAEEEIAQLVALIRHADERLQALLGKEVESVAASDAETVLLQRTQEQQHRLAALQQEDILAALPAHIALLDARGVIVSVNAAWKAFARDNGMRAPGDGVGASYLDACDHAADDASAAHAAQGIRSVLSGYASGFQLEYPCHSPSQERWFKLRASPLINGPWRGAIVMHQDITPRVQATRQLELLWQETSARERMLNAALSSITDFTYIIDSQGRILFANQRTLDLWGVTLEQAVGKNSYDLGYPAESAQKIQAQIQSVFATGRSVQDELAYLSPTGLDGYYEYQFSAVLAKGGGVEFVVGCSTDITQKRRSELALQESFAEFRTLAAAMPQIVWQSTAQREVIYLNQQWMDYTGLTLGEGLAGGWNDVIYPQDRLRVAQAHSDAVGGTYAYEARLRRADGVYRWWLVRGLALTDDNGALLKWIGTCTDIDDLKQAELEVLRTNRELQQQGAELRLVLDLVPAMIWFKDTDGRVLRVNERGASRLGRTVAELEGVMIDEVFPEAEAARYRASDLEMIRTGEPIFGQLERQIDAAGLEIWVQKDKVPFRDPDGKVVGIVVMDMDVTGRKRDQDALRELNAELEDRVRLRTAELDLARQDAESANQAKSEFLATMSHEIRTPMSGLLGLLELLSVGGLDAEQLSTLSVARESGDALMRIINDILDFSKIEANNLELNLVAASVASVVASACRLHAQVAASKNLALRTAISSQISPLLSVDPLRLSQILNNFLNNAIKFTGGGGVDVAVELVGRHEDMEELLFTVRDTGIGMTPEQVSRLFQPFVQAAAETSAQFGGTGLGLVISRRLAELMGGTVDVESELGVGTCISLRLYLEVCDANGPARSETADQEQLQALVAGRRPVPSIEDAQADGSLLLIVDDHPTNRTVLMRQAASLGYAAEAVHDGAQALLAWRSGRFAAVITDCSMPVMDGYELAGAIRKAEGHAGGRTPIIACTANALPSAAQACLGCGMDDCLVKPASLADLSAALARWVPLAASRSAPAPTSPPPAEALPHRAGAARREGLLDLLLLAEISGGDQLAQAEMLLDFRRVNESDAAALRMAVAQADFARVMEFSHRIKGSCLMLGATLLGQVCARAEAAGAARDMRALIAVMSSFESELLRLNGYLEMFPSLGRKRP